MNALHAGLVFVGAGAGGLVRALLGEWSKRLLGNTFPWGTLVVNVTGCLAAGLVWVWLSAGNRDGGPRVGLTRESLLMVGLLGGYTTFSAFGRETLGLLETGRWAAAGANIALNNGVGLLAAWAGLSLGRRIWGVP